MPYGAEKNTEVASQAPNRRIAVVARGRDQLSVGAESDRPDVRR